MMLNRKNLSTLLWCLLLAVVLGEDTTTSGPEDDATTSAGSAEEPARDLGTKTAEKQTPGSANKTIAKELEVWGDDRFERDPCKCPGECMVNAHMPDDCKCMLQRGCTGKLNFDGSRRACYDLKCDPCNRPGRDGFGRCYCKFFRDMDVKTDYCNKYFAVSPGLQGLCVPCRGNCMRLVSRSPCKCELNEDCALFELEDNEIGLGEKIAQPIEKSLDQPLDRFIGVRGSIDTGLGSFTARAGLTSLAQVTQPVYFNVLAFLAAIIRQL